MFIGAGNNNVIAATSGRDYSSIVNGKDNYINSYCAGILGGQCNCLTHNESFIIGSKLASTADCTTYVNNINISGSITHGNAADGFIILTHVSESLNFADDAAAATGGVPLGGLYRSGNVISIRIE